MKLLLALSLSIWLSLHRAQANDAPCLPAEFIDGYNVFLKRHLSSGTPASLDHEDWEEYLSQNTDCERSLQSFLSPEDQGKVEDICRSGKRQSRNYCISRNKFTFISVQSELGTCIIRNVTEVTQHIIVACDRVDNVCLPTHLEENQKDLVPWYRDPDCDLGLPLSDHGVTMRAAGQSLSVTLLGLALCYLMG